MFMKSFFSFLAGAVLFSSQALAQSTVQQFSAHCINGKSLAEVMEQFGEVPSLTMNSVREVKNNKAVENRAVLFINFDTKSWTMIERVAPDRFCVLATGEEITPYLKK